nr:hypothetical protein [Bacteroidales bacterium]
GNSMNKLQLSVDILNFGNLLNDKWGLPSVLDCNSGKLLECTNAEQISSTVAPVYKFSGVNDHTYRKGSSIYSTWHIQVGIRYMFN